MGLFDMFAKKGPGALKKHGARAANARAQNPDRWESIQALVSMKTPEAVAALLGRFKIRIDPSIIDQEEKDAAFQGIVDAGDLAVEPVKEFLKKSEQVSWPIKILERLISSEALVTELLALLATMGTEYERDPEKKIQLVAYLEDRKDPRIVSAVLRFFDDANETARFHAIGAALAQDDAESAFAELLDLVEREESVRIRARILEGWKERGFAIPAAHIDKVRPMLPEGWALDAAGHPRR